MMLWLIFGGIITLLAAYVVYTLITSYGSEYTDNSFESFLDNSSSLQMLSNIAQDVKLKKDKYQRIYDQPGRQVLIIYATEYGFSKELAQELFDKIEICTSDAIAVPLQPRIVDAKNFTSVDLMQESCLLVVISTAGDGVPPSDARNFITWLLDSRLCLNHLRYSVLALGNSNYIHFCRAGKTVDQRLQELGAHCFENRKDVDSEDSEAIHQWFSAVLHSLDSMHIESKFDYLQLTYCDDKHSSREQPLCSMLQTKYNLTRIYQYGDKETVHCEFDITNSGIVWTSGDALGIYPENDPALVQHFLEASKHLGTMLVPVPRWAHCMYTGDMLPLGMALQRFYDLKNIKPELLLLLQHHASRGTSDSGITINSVLKDGIFKTNTLLQEYLDKREVSDVIEDFKDIASKVDIIDLLGQIKPLLPRYYSISSSPTVDPNVVCITAAVVRYQSLGKDRVGVATTFLQDRLSVGQSCQVFVSQNPYFRLPMNLELPIIMIGPGTGLAPFRAFIQERVALQSAGLNLLYFGCRHKEQDFLYRAELENWVTMGKLELRTAFSRDQERKTYVQDLIREDCKKIWDLISAGAHLYVCGDARQMAHDVHDALLDTTKRIGGLKGERDAENFLSQLEINGRYQKDTWVI